MEQQLYKLILDGQMAEGHDPETVKEDLGRLFELDLNDVERLLANAPVEIKRNLDRATAEKMQEGLVALGALCQAVAMSRAESVTCPTCGYQAMGEDDPLITGAGGLGTCPNCNNIRTPEKPEAPVRPVEKKEARPVAQPAAKPAAQTPAAAEKPRPAAMPAEKKPPVKAVEKKPPLPVASYGRRILAGLHTFFSTLCMLLLFTVPALLIKSYYAQLLGLPSSPATDLEAVRAAFFFLCGAAILIYVVTLWMVPAKGKCSWGQKAMGIEIRTKKGETPKGGAYFLRFLGNLLVAASLGILFLVNLVSGDKSGLADLLSGTRQHESVEPPEKHVQKAVTPILVAFFLAAGIVLLFLPIVMKVR